MNPPSIILGGGGVHGKPTGFNEHVKDLHDIARQYYLVWRDAGKSRNDETHSDMRRSRLQFKADQLDSLKNSAFCLKTSYFMNK